MIIVLLLLLVALPIVEIAVFIQVGSSFGYLMTIGLLIVVSMVGSWLVKYQGLGLWHKMRVSIGQGQVPGKELVDAALVMLAGVLLLTPGFLTDVVAILLLLPPIRAGVRALFLRRCQQVVAVQRRMPPR